jgi:quinol monooxygenase YgiN
MYGTIARCRVRQGAEAQLLAQLREFEAAKVAGAITTLIYRMDADPQEYYMAVIFSDREAYVANAQSTEQEQRYQKMVSLMEGPPEWHDGEIVAMVGQMQMQPMKP